MNPAIVSATEPISSAIASLEVELTKTTAGTSDYKLLLTAIRDLSDVLELLVAAGRPF